MAAASITAGGPNFTGPNLPACMAVRKLQTAWRRTLAPRTTQRLAEAYDRVLSIEHVRQIRYCCLGCFAPSSFGVVY
jgi:hypothetical protein